ncbi:indolepyruvate ferredoxin oxidoreductase family protein [Sphingomonas bacterium]|uniref:indolepyruvate ferredoxin oxidoreductase family protein n=1 Tax=Sphingomonas bacterium TaxID=1895847 RepID=UPI001575BD43|nr:indolepyruvate ferredoxin oxidoreductase family protein [Sphingomonas bacterium]
MAGTAVTLDDKWATTRGRVLLSGAQAIARVLLARAALDRAAGLNTAGYVSGYRGSPLGNVDTALWAVGDRLAAAGVKFAPGINEDIAATAVRGTQQLGSVPGPRFDGVFAAWYGKGPGVDRSLDALKHGNYGGAHRNGGVLLFYGDDHAGKSSTVSHQSEQAMAAAQIPSLYPADVGEIIDYGLLGYAMSRYSGSWVGMKLVNEIAEQTLTVDIDLDGVAPVLPPQPDLPPEGLHVRADSRVPLREEQIVVEHRLPAIQRFVRANRIDRTSFCAVTPRLGLVTAGKSHGDTRQALALLGLDDARAAALGLSLYKVGCIWPLEPEGLLAFARGHATLLVIEEKKSFVEAQAASLLVNAPERPRLIGKRDEAGAPLLSETIQLEPIAIALAIAGRLPHLGIADPEVTAAAARLQAILAPAADALPPLPLRRAPYFCSGCPHSRSTKVPDGSLSMTGIGCHTMAALVRPEQALAPTHMGGEGGNWIGLAPFTGTRHMFQNMGDGTYHHSGLLAIRAAVAAKVNITYKILYNDAVAMTGGQPVDGPISVAEIAQQVRHEGVGTIVLLSDDPDAHRGNPALPPDVRIEDRDRLDTIQRELRDTPGCTVLIYEQTCAAEKRRRRKRGLYPHPPKRLFISEAVCEGCGDCSVQSTCMSLQPVETDWGLKRRIDQASCNKDYSCLDGFCPSFITVEGAEPRKPAVAAIDPALFADLPEPARAPLDDGFAMMIAGIGGTGVITVAAILGMAAHLDGHAASLFDMTGLAQKNGAVFSHVRIAAGPERLHAQKLGRGEADVLLGLDLVAALSGDAMATAAPGRTRALVDSDVVPTLAFQFNRDLAIDGRLLAMRLQRQLGAEAVSIADAAGIAAALLGDGLGGNLFLVGLAAQKGLLPVSVAAIERAVRLNDANVVFNLAAFGLGRVFTVDPARLAALLPAKAAPLDQSLDALVERRAAHLTAYQDAAYAARYRAMVERVRAAERAIAPDSEALATAVARNYAKLLAYKDEYEVARLLTDPALAAELRRRFADGARFRYNLAPPLLGGTAPNGRPRKRAFNAAAMRPLLAVMARAKRLRGTMLDPFGYGAERRSERRLIAGYEALVEGVLRDLAPDTLGAGIALLGLADMVRGFGPVKHTAIAAYAAAVAAHRAPAAAAAAKIAA